VNTTVITPDVAQALAELRGAFPNRVTNEPDELGGALVTIAGVHMPSGWPLTHSELTFVIPFNFPAIPLYPYYIPAEAAPAGQLPTALQRIEWRGAAVLQLSLRHTAWRPGVDTVLGSMLQAIDWLRCN